MFDKPNMLVIKLIGNRSEEDMRDYTVTIETERLILRKFKITDVDDLYEYASDEEVTKFLSFETYKSRNDGVDYITNVALPKYNEENSYKWAIEYKENGKMIGSIDCSTIYLKRKCAELGYVLNRSYWGKGIMPEAAQAVIEYLFQEGFERIEAVHDVNNPKSGRVMQKVGMTHEGTMRKSRCHTKNGKTTFVDCELYAIIAED